MIHVLSPKGPPGGAPRALAGTPAVLAGARLGVLDNRKPNARLLLTTLAEGVAARTGARVTLVTEKANAAVRGEAEVLARLRAGADVIITGSGD